MTALDWAPWLGCPSCPELWEASEADADATLSDLREHIEVKHTRYDRPAAMALLAKARPLTNEQAARMQSR